MNPTNKKKCVLGLAIILSLLIVTAIPLILPNNQSSFPPQVNILTNPQPPNLTVNKANPQPVNLWWNYNWNYRMELNVTEPGYSDRKNETATVHLNFGDNHCYNNSIRVAYYNHSTALWVEVPIQLDNVSYNGNYITACDLMFLCNVTKGGTSTYYVYYTDDYSGGAPTYTTPLSINIAGAGTTNFTFQTGVISGYYNIRYSYTVDPDTGKYFDDDACFRIFNVAGTNVIPTSGLHSGIDRIDADDLQRWGETPYNELNWTAILLENGPLRAIVRIYKTSTDRFTSTSKVGDGTYGAMNKTYTFYAYQSYVKVNVVNATPSYNTVPIYDFAVVNITNQWKLYIDTYDLGVATNWPWTDKISSPQPFNHMSLVRNDGLGLALLGSPLWPEDEFGQRTSVEYGYGDIEGHYAPGYPPKTIKSFLIRNDGRPGDPLYGSVEYRIRIPFTYYVTGITQGYDQVIDTWYQVNNPTQVTPDVEEDKFYPLVAYVTDWFYNPIPGANVTIYNAPALGPANYNTSNITNSQGRYSFLLNENYSTTQYWIQAYVNKSYENYTSQAYRWNPIENFTYPSSTLNIRMNITSVYVEAWDNANHRIQNATVTLNYINESLTDISQVVDEFYASCLFYAWANQNLNTDIYVNPGTPEGISKIYKLFPNGTIGPEVNPPINTNEPKRFRVEIDRNIGAQPTELSTTPTTILNKYWKDNVTFNVWLKAGDTPIDPESINFTIYNSLEQKVVDATPMIKVSVGLYSYTFNTSTIPGVLGTGLLPGDTYTIAVSARNNITYLNPTPISIFLPLQKLPVEVFSDYLEKPIEATWTETLHLSMPAIAIRLTDVHNNLRINNANVIYTISGTTHVNEKMSYTGTPGWYKVNDTVVDDLRPGNYVVNIVSSLQNYTIPSAAIQLNIKYVPTQIWSPTKVQGNFDENISINVEFKREVGNTSITGASVSWIIQGTNITGELSDPSNIGNYSGQILSGTIPSGSYVLIIQAYKENYTTSFKYISLDVVGAPTALASVFMIPQLFGSSEYLYAGPLIQVENWWLLVPISFTYLDSNGNPVPNATITVTGGLPVIGAQSKGGIGELEIHGLQLPGGVYLILMPIMGFPPSTLLINIVASATNFQTQQIPIVLSIKEKAIPFGPWRIPVSVFLLTLAAIAIPTTAFVGYSIYKRAKIPAIIKRIDELIKAISRGEKVTPRPILREKVVSAILSEELAIVGVEPRVEKYIPVELADLIVPLLVESGMQEKEAYALAVELKTAPPADKERLLESVGIPGETSARIIQMIEEYEEKQEPFRKAPRRKTPKEPEEKEEPTEEAEESQPDKESEAPD